MEKSIQIGDKTVAMKATASTVRRYRQKFGKDLFKELKPIMQAQGTEYDGYLTMDVVGDVFSNMSYIMAKQADPSVTDDPEEWLDQFDMMDIVNAIPQIIELWGLSTQSLSAPKKK